MSNRKSPQLLGEGSYGCVFTPQIACSKNYRKISNKKYENAVSKVFTSKSGVADENRFAKLVFKWDALGDYFVVPIALCKTDIDVILKHPKAQECSALDFTFEKYIPQIVMPNGGVDLQKFLKTRIGLATWVGLLENLFKAALIMNEQGYIHCDIKPENILYDKTAHKLRLFDFSLTVHKKDIYKKKYSNRLQFPYFVYPIDFLLVYYNKYHPNHNVSILDEFHSNVTSFGDRAYRIYTYYHPKDEIQRSRENIREWINTDKDWYKYMLAHTDKIDLYSIGMVCVEVHNSIDFKGVAPAIIKRYIEFIQSITAIDVRERPTLSDALDDLLALKKTM